MKVRLFSLISNAAARVRKDFAAVLKASKCNPFKISRGASLTPTASPCCPNFRQPVSTSS